MYLEGLPDGGEKILYGTTEDGRKFCLYGVSADDLWPDLTLGERCGVRSDPALGFTCNRPAGHDGRHGFSEYQDDGSVEHRYWP